MFPTYTCDRCKKEIKAGEFIAVLGEAPSSGINTPIARADKLFKDIGATYCQDCLPEVVEHQFE